MGGIFLIAHQLDGYVYAFDLSLVDTNIIDLVGTYQTKRSESCGLEFDRSIGCLYILHNTNGNYLELTRLESIQTDKEGVRRFVVDAEYRCPNNGNLEGFACTPQAGSENWCFFTNDDNGTSGDCVENSGLLWFRNFHPLAMLPPRFLPGLPASAAVGATAVKIIVALDQPGMLYAVAVEAAEPVPSPGQVVAGLDGTGGAAAVTRCLPMPGPGEVSMLELEGLVPDRDWKICLVAEDDSSPVHRQAVVTEMSVRTVAGPTREFRITAECNGVTVGVMAELDGGSARELPATWSAVEAILMHVISFSPNPSLSY